MSELLPSSPDVCHSNEVRGDQLGFYSRRSNGEQSVDAKALAKEVEEEINERVRSGVQVMHPCSDDCKYCAFF